MKEKILSVLMVLLTGLTAVAQDLSKFKVFGDSAYQADTMYQSCNKYQKDAILFMDLVADTHPYYVAPERREEWYAKKAALLEKCKSMETDEALADALNEVLGKLKDKHTCVTTAKQVREATLAERKKLTDAGITSFAPDREHIMRPHATVYDYQIFPEHSICYLQFNKCANNPADPFSSFLDRMFAEMKEADIKTLVVDVQYNGGGNDYFCSLLMEHLYPFDKLKTFTAYTRLSDFMTEYFPNAVGIKKNREEEGHKDELYQEPANKTDSYQQPKLYEGQVVFVMGPMTFSSAGILLTHARDNHFGTIIGTTSTFRPSHYGNTLPFRLPNTAVYGTVSCQFYARPDNAKTDEPCLQPDIEVNLDDKDATWKLVIEKYGATADSNPGWLWEVSGNGLAQKSYLFGTCHGDGHDFTREEVLGISGLDDALNDVNAILFEGGLNTEITKTDSAEMISELEKMKKMLTHPGPEYMMPEGTYYKPLFDTVAHFNEVNKFLYYQMKDPEYWKKNPCYWLVRMRFYIAFGMRRGTPLDVVLKQETVNRGIETRYVEEREQISGTIFSKFADTSGIDTLSMKEQVKSLYSIVHYFINNDNVTNYFRTFADIYLKNDTCMMWNYLNEAGFVAGAESEEDSGHEILHDRNVKWIPVIEQNISKGACMVAVGCRHLLGSESLIALLRRKGYTVEPVKN